jgi:eukaryotic-like serine/threonine-protein kinase
MAEKLSTNSTVSHYRIVSKIGAGGMGEVYRARDSRLDRDVAIKMLPVEVAKDIDRLKRFEQEAKATSALNHPNILTVYDIGENDGVPFIVSELLEGEELRDRLNEGAIPLRKTIDYAQQIVSGLSAAHERGITHRDLKPENLFVTKDDRIKILDFGLAKLREAPTNVHGSEDATKRALTDPGVVMGTVGYMSPEQVRGSVADHRSDIFSFGVILYEMLTGNRAFSGESVVETMHSILKEDVTEVQENSGVRIPPALDKLMRRCLEKKPDHRFHSAHDLGFALDAIASPTSSSDSGLTVAANSLSSETRGSGLLRHLAWVVAAVFLISTVALAVLYLQREAPSSPTMRFALAPPEKNSFTEGFALSPDGKSIAFVARNSLGLTALWVRPLNSVDARLLAGTEGVSFPFWSPDSRSIGFFAGGKLRKIDAAGGPSQSLADAASDPRGGTWAPDGTIIFAPNTLSPLMKVPASGGAVSEVTKVNTEIGQTSHRWPKILPDRKHFLYFGRGGAVERQGIYGASVDNPEPTLLVISPVAGDYTEVDGVGYLLFVREGTLMMQRFDPAKLELSGEATPVVEHVLTFPGEVGPTAYSAFSAAAGNLVYRTGDQQTTRLTWHDRDGKALESIGEPGGYHEPLLSKDGTKILYGRNDGTGPQDVFLHDLKRGNSTRLTFDAASDSTTVVSPDETQVVFFSNRAAKQGIYRKSSSGAGSEETIWIDQFGIYPSSWSPDGKAILCDKNGGPRTKLDVWVVPMNGEQPYPYIATEFEEAHAQFSPDGRWVAYTSNESGRAEIYVQSFPIGNGKWQISVAGGDQPMWRQDGKELFYVAPDNGLVAVAIATGGTTIDVSRPQVLFQAQMPLGGGVTDDRNNYVPTPDGQKFLVNTLADAADTEPLVVVLNWGREIKK